MPAFVKVGIVILHRPLKAVMLYLSLLANMKMASNDSRVVAIM